MRKTALAIVLLASMAILITGCSKSDQPTLYVFNWGEYIDESVIEQFEKEFGVRVVYDVYSTNEDMYVKLTSGGSTYDVVIPSDYMVKRLIDEGRLEKLNFNNIPNAKYIEPWFSELGYDPTGEYAVPYMWGTIGILYNKKMVHEPVTSWKILWDKKYEKQILMMDSQRDSIGAALKMLGYSLNTTNVAELEAAGEALKAQKPLVLAYVVEEVRDKMPMGEAALALVWSGDAIYAMQHNPDLEYVIPEEGTNLWVDSMVIPKGTKNKELAEKLINFLCRPEIAYLNAQYTGYATPHIEAKKKLDPAITENKAAYPDEEELARMETYKVLGTMLRDYDRIWTEVKSL